MRRYKTSNKKKVAMAYGFSKVETLMYRIMLRIKDDTPEETMEQLNTMNGHEALLPDQVKAIVEVLGTPQDPDALYSEI